MIQIRKAMFETNSSSTHSMVIALESDFEKWTKGEVFYVGESWCFDSDALKGKDFFTKDELIDLIKTKQERARAADDYVYFEDFKGTFDEEDLEMLHEENIWENLNAYHERYEEYHEFEESTFVTPSGEKIRIMCHYGYDG